MLTVCLHKLCPQDRLANGFRKVETYAKNAPRRVEHRLREALKWPPGSLRRAFAGRQAAKAARKPTLSGSWALLGHFWRLLDLFSRKTSRIHGTPRHPWGNLDPSLRVKNSLGPRARFLLAQSLRNRNSGCPQPNTLAALGGLVDGSWKRP